MILPGPCNAFATAWDLVDRDPLSCGWVKNALTDRRDFAALGNRVERMGAQGAFQRVLQVNPFGGG